MVWGYLQIDSVATLAESNSIVPTLKPSFCRQRANRRAPSFASSSLRRMNKGRRALHNTDVDQNINEQSQLFLFFWESTTSPKYRLVDVKKCYAYLVAPVQMIFPEDQMEAVILGLRSFIRTFCNKDKTVQLSRTTVRFLHGGSR